MSVKIQGGLLGSTELDVISMTARTKGTIQGKDLTVKGDVVMKVEGGDVQVSGRKILITSEKGTVEVSAPEVRIKTPGGTVVVDATGVSISGAMVKLNCR